MTDSPMTPEEKARFNQLTSTVQESTLAIVVSSEAVYQKALQHFRDIGIPEIIPHIEKQRAFYLQLQNKG